MKRCTRCILPEICPRIQFDQKGICNVCRDFEKKWGNFAHEKTARKRKLGRILATYRNNGPEYDCLVPVSGGLDSIYVLYVCKRIYNMRTLAFNFDNGFQTTVAKDNLENAIKTLNVDLNVVNPGWETIKRLYRIFFMKTGEFCTPCNLGIWSTSYKLAEDLNIPLIVSGVSDRIRERLPNNGRIYSWTPSYFRKVIHDEISLKDAADYLHLPDDFHDRSSDSMRVFSFKNVEVLPLFNYVDYDTKLMMKTLTIQLNWKPRAERFHHIDCVMQPVHDYFKQRKWGFSAAPWYSMLLRTKQLSRREALKITAKEEKENKHRPPELKLWLERLDLSEQDLDGFEKRSQIPYTER